MRREPPSWRAPTLFIACSKSCKLRKGCNCGTWKYPFLNPSIHFPELPSTSNLYQGFWPQGIMCRSKKKKFLGYILLCMSHWPGWRSGVYKCSNLKRYKLRISFFSYKTYLSYVLSFKINVALLRG